MSLSFLLVVGFCIAKSNNFECDIAVTLHQETLHEHAANQSHISTTRTCISIMQGGLNIIHTLTQVKRYGIALFYFILVLSLEAYTNWDKDIQDTPELRVGFRGGITVIKIHTMSLVNEDDGEAPTAPLTIASR